MRPLFAVLTWLMLFATPVVAGDFEDGQFYFDAKKDHIAFPLLKPLAKQGHAEAQGALGVMYVRELGVPKNYAKAAYWHRKAAAQGRAASQLVLGNFYSNGTGVPVSYIHAYAWYSIVGPGALDVPHEIVTWSANYFRSSLEEKMTPDQIAKGQELAAEYWEKYVVPFQKD